MKSKYLLLLLVFLKLFSLNEGLQGHFDQEQRISFVEGEVRHFNEKERIRREDGKSGKYSDNADVVIDEKISSSKVFISKDYRTTFSDISSKFQLENLTPATINKFFHHPINNCYYVFTDIFHKHIFVTLDCGKTISTYPTTFSPRHLEFDTKFDGRFLIHDKESEKKELYVTKNFGETFSHAGDFIKAFYWDYKETKYSLLIKLL